MSKKPSEKSRELQDHMLNGAMSKWNISWIEAKYLTQEDEGWLGLTRIKPLPKDLLIKSYLEYIRDNDFGNRSVYDKLWTFFQWSKGILANHFNSKQLMEFNEDAKWVEEMFKISEKEDKWQKKHLLLKDEEWTLKQVPRGERDEKYKEKRKDVEDRIRESVRDGRGV